MLRYIYADQLLLYPKLAHTMFTDRAEQFSRRLKWDVRVDANGQERDEYDAENPLYVIWEKADGSHGGSMRFLPTTGRTMVNEVFSHLIGGVSVKSPLIWECTRFCLTVGAPRNIAAALVLGGSEIMARMHIRQFVGVFDARMVRIYRAIGASPYVLGSTGQGSEQISVGLWSYCESSRSQVAQRSRISLELSTKWYDASCCSSVGEAAKKAG